MSEFQQILSFKNSCIFVASKTAVVAAADVVVVVAAVIVIVVIYSPATVSVLQNTHQRQFQRRPATT